MSRSMLLVVPAVAVGFAAGVAAGVVVERRKLAVPPQGVQHEQPALVQSVAPRECTAERAELNSTRAQLAICMAYERAEPQTKPADQASDALSPAEQFMAEEIEGVRRFRQVLREHKEVVIVRRADNSVDAFPAADPIPDGIIVARRLPSGEFAWYTGTGSREDPASFRTVDTSHLKPPVFRSREQRGD